MKVVESEVYVAVYFKKSVKPRKPRTIMAVDVNFDNITLAVFTTSGKLLRLNRFKTPLRKILTHRIWVERIRKDIRGLGGSPRALEELSESTARGLETSHGATHTRWETL